MCKNFKAYKTKKLATPLKQKQPLCVISLLFICIATLELPLASPIRPAEGFTCFASSAPCANFTHTPITPYVNDTVNFDASATTPNGGNIISYEWNFGDGTNGTGVFTTKIYTEAGNYTVTLTVTDDEGEKDTTWKVITVIPQPDGAAIDLYNQKGGQGPNQPDGAFALGETVTLTALLTYDEEPVQNKLVGFEVIDPTGEIVLNRSNVTDADGLATVNFTVPVLCLPNIFGTWIAAATASVSEQIVSDTLTFKVRGPYIDVYTQKEPYNGQGPNEPSDAFAPQEEVILYAYVSYNCEPEQNKPVGFEVTNPSGEVIVDRAAFTNTEGIANITFRIPWPCENPEQTVFGIWSVTGKASVLNLTAEDTLTFQVGWIIEITEVKTVDVTGAVKNSFAKGEHVCFNLTARNIAFISKTATFTIVVYDEENVPIGRVILHNWVIPSGLSRFFIIDLQIPQWAFIGFGTAYANAYTNLPRTGGVPYCPETPMTFIIQTS